MDYHPPLPLRAILAKFIADGYLARHIAKLRVGYGERWRRPRAERAALPEMWVETVPGNAGHHRTMLLDGRLNDRRIVDRLSRPESKPHRCPPNAMTAKQRA